jgi:hypothetical protein
MSLLMINAGRDVRWQRYDDHRAVGHPVTRDATRPAVA